jgi:CRP-like cAMP-binding protein
MSDPQLLNLLRRVQLLEGVSEEHLDKLAAIARCVDFEQDATIFREGEPATTMYLVLTGRVSLEICAPGVGCKQILTVGEGELLGWSPVLDNEQFTATARALAPTRTIELAGGDVRALCEEYPRLGYEFMRCAALALGKRLSATRLQLLNLYGDEPVRSPAGKESGGTS